MSRDLEVAKEEIEQLPILLSKLEVGFLPFEIFMQLARLVALPVLELVVLRRIGNEIEVLLLKRNADDTLWPNQLHSAGSVIRAYDSDPSFKDAINRIVDIELGGIKICQPVFVESFLNESKRGKECAQVYYAEAQGEPISGKFYNVDRLPAGIMKSQLVFISRAAQAFKER